MIKLLGIDLDGTLLDSRGALSEANRKAIRLAEQVGVLVTICTGRRFRDARPIALDLELNAPMVSHNGALIKYASTLETFDVSILDKSTVQQVLEVARSSKADALLSADPDGKGVLYYEKASKRHTPLIKYIAWAKRLHGEEAEDAIHCVNSFDEVIDRIETVHISFSGTCAQMRELQHILQSEVSAEINILTTVYPHVDFTLIDVLPPSASKGYGLERIANAFGFQKSEIMAIGDNLNDLQMLEFAGVPVVMANASPELLEDERYHKTLSNNENGVALAIEKFILNNNR